MQCDVLFHYCLSRAVIYHAEPRCSRQGSVTAIQYSSLESPLAASEESRPPPRLQLKGPPQNAVCCVIVIPGSVYHCFYKPSQQLPPQPNHTLALRLPLLTPFLTVNHSTHSTPLHYRPLLSFYSRAEHCVCILIWTQESRRKLCQVFDCWRGGGGWGVDSCVYIRVKKPNRLTFRQEQQCVERLCAHTNTHAAL